jgi:hypothetical protein
MSSPRQRRSRHKHSFRGVFHGTPSTDGIVQTSEFDGMPGHVCLETITFTEREVTTVIVSVRSRDMVTDLRRDHLSLWFGCDLRQ